MCQISQGKVVTYRMSYDRKYLLFNPRIFFLNEQLILALKFKKIYMYMCTVD